MSLVKCFKLAYVEKNEKKVWSKSNLKNEKLKVQNGKSKVQKGKLKVQNGKSIVQHCNNNNNT